MRLGTHKQQRQPVFGTDRCVQRLQMEDESGGGWSWAVAAARVGILWLVRPSIGGRRWVSCGRRRQHTDGGAGLSMTASLRLEEYM
jgi:hypothetical protein